MGELKAAGPVVVMAAGFTNVAYERLAAEDDDEVVQIQPPVEEVSGDGGVSNNLFPDPSSGFPFFNLPLGMANCQLPVDGWAGNSVGRPF